MTLILQGTDNSVSSPAVQGGTAGTTTGVYYPASNQIALATNGTLALIVDASQNVGLGVTPSAWYSTSSQALQFGVGATYSHTYSGTTGYGIAYNTYSSSVGGGWKYVANGYAHILEQSDAYQTLYSSDSGTAGASVSSLTQTLALGKGVSLSLQGATPKTGTGITFPATQSASSDANTLDDYEEGTWTPTDGSGAGLTFSNTSGNCIYTKIGRTVIASFRVTYPSTANTSFAYIGGLPFATANTTVNVHPVVFSEQSYSAGVTGNIGTNDTKFLILTTSGGSVAIATNANVSGKDFRGVAIYQTA